MSATLPAIRRVCPLPCGVKDPLAQSAPSAEHDLDASEGAVSAGRVRDSLDLLPRRRHAVPLTGESDLWLVDRDPRRPVNEHAVQLVREVAHG